MNTWCFVLLSSFVLAAGACPLGAQGTITADPNARQLRPIWLVQGDGFVGGDEIGAGIGGLGDIYGPGTSAWAVLYGSLFEWRIYRHDFSTGSDLSGDTVPVQRYSVYGAIPWYPVVGDFWGTGHRAVGLATERTDSSGPRTKFYYKLHVYRSESNRLTDTPSAIFDSEKMRPKYVNDPDDILAVDLDGDGADELIMAWQAAYADTGYSEYPELWIYRGGSGFQLDSPTVMIKHPLRNGGGNRIHAVAGDFDGDHHPDIVISRGGQSDGRNHLTFYWGTDSITTFGNTQNQRIIPLTDDYPKCDLGIAALDCDGDGKADLAAGRTLAAPIGTYVYRTSTGKSARTRTFRLDDADAYFANASFLGRGGYANDSGRRFEMLAFSKFEGEPASRPNLTLFAGGTNGPDQAYDAYSQALVLARMPIPDVNNDGWEDYMGGNYNTNGINTGIAVIFAGGPYIPGPKVSGVESVAGEGHAQAFAVWPNPVRDELRMAWRGDLRRMPARFAVSDAAGREIAGGDVAPGRGAAVWRAVGVPAGAYLLSVYDAAGVAIGTARIVKY